MIKLSQSGRSPASINSSGQFQREVSSATPTLVPQSADSRAPALYTLPRDNERPLQFKGSVLAEIESGSGLVNRAAIYQTIAGKFIVEFSSRPMGHDRKLSRCSADEIGHLITGFTFALQVHVEVYAEEKDKHPSDLRYSNRYEALANVLELLDQLDIDNPQWQKLWQLYEEGGGMEEFGWHEERFFNRFGFDTLADHEINMSASEFLQRLMAETRSVRAAELASGKSLVFESLDEALAWFKPGKLTTQLLRKLGRLEPEFVE